MIEMLREYIDLGLPIIPICSHDHKNMSPRHIERCKCAGKTPLIKDWQHQAVTTEKDLTDWIKQFKSFNVGLPLGDASGYCGIDVDGEEGVKLLMDMSKGDLPLTWEFTTGAGSRLIYAIPAGIKTKKFKQTGSGAHQECALLCNGQQTVLPPSIHYSGRKYEWLEGHDPWSIDCAVAPDWLIELIRLDENASTSFKINLSAEQTRTTTLEDEFEATDMSFDAPPEAIASKNVRAQVGKTGHKIVVTEELLTSPIPEGTRDNTMTAIIGHYCANRDLRRLGKDFIMQICLKHNADYCQPPLEEQAIRDKVEYFFTAESMKDADYKEKKEKKVFEASKMAKAVLQYLENKGILLQFDQFSKAYYYTTTTKGPWNETRNYALVNKWIREVITSTHWGDPTYDKRSYVEETRVALEESFTAAYKNVSDFDIGAHSEELRDYIVVNNGMVDWKTRNLIPWDPAVKTTISFDIDYDPEATCPKWEKYMSQWLPDESVRCVMQEFLGYCLIPNTNYRKALFLYGKGKNGKSMLIEFLQEFFGKHSSALSYDGLFTRFGPSQLQGKIVNIFDDTTVSFAKETSIAKNLIAGGTISAEYKGKDIFQFTNVARLIYSSQETPKTADTTVAWYDRWFFVKFPNQFRPSNLAKITIQRDLEKEKAGIFNWMIEGLARLLRQDDFTKSDELVLTNTEYRSKNDSVTHFLSSMCIIEEDDHGDSINDLYKVYEIWSAAENLKPVSKKVFSARIYDMGFNKIKGYLNGKSGQTYFKGIFLNKEAEDYIENAFEISVALQAR